VLILATNLFRVKVREAYRDIRGRVARINANLQESLTGIRVIQLFNQERRAFDRFEKVNREHMEAYQRSILYYALFYPGVELIGAIAIGLIIWYAGAQALDGAITLGTIMAFLQFNEMFWRPIRDLSEKDNILQTAMASSERVFHLLDDKTMINEHPHPTPLEHVRGEIEFRIDLHRLAEFVPASGLASADAVDERQVLAGGRLLVPREQAVIERGIEAPLRLVEAAALVLAQPEGQALPRLVAQLLFGDARHRRLRRLLAHRGASGQQRRRRDHRQESRCSRSHAHSFSNPDGPGDCARQSPRRRSGHPRHRAPPQASGRRKNGHLNTCRRVTSSRDFTWMIATYGANVVLRTSILYFPGASFRFLMGGLTACDLPFTSTSPQGAIDR